MTASSVEFFPCRVQLMGITPSSTSIAATNTSINIRNSTRPSISKIQKVSRNLFGSPDPVEMKNFYQQETERLRLYVWQRYNFDTNEPEQQLPTDIIHNKTTNNPALQPTQFPTLIEQELRQHEQRLQDEEQNLNRVSLSMTPSYGKSSNHAKNGPKVTRRCCEYSSRSPPAERQMPYVRQSLLTDSFNIRKTKNGKQCIADIKKLENNHRNFGIIQLPPTTILQQTTNDLEDKGNELPICNEVSTTLSYSDNCTTLSLQFVASTQNLS